MEWNGLLRWVCGLTGPALPYTRLNKLPIESFRSFFLFPFSRVHLRFLPSRSLQQEHRSVETGKSKMAAVGKALGMLWKELADDQKRAYHERAAAERAHVEAQVLERERKQGNSNNNQSSSNSISSTKRGAANNADLVLPLAKVKKICKLDPDVRGLSREALAAIAKASELVLAKLGMESVKVAAMQNRRTLLPDDVVVVCQNREHFSFLREDILDLTRLQRQHKLDNKNNSSKKKGSAPTSAPDDDDADDDAEDADEEVDVGHDDNRGAAALRKVPRKKKQKLQQQQLSPPSPPPPPPPSTRPLTAYFARK
jgi:histone H3/H4